MCFPYLVIDCLKFITRSREVHFWKNYIPRMRLEQSLYLNHLFRFFVLVTVFIYSFSVPFFCNTHVINLGGVYVLPYTFIYCSDYFVLGRIVCGDVWDMLGIRAVDPWSHQYPELTSVHIKVKSSFICALEIARCRSSGFHARGPRRQSSSPHYYHTAVLSTYFSGYWRGFTAGRECNLQVWLFLNLIFNLN